MTTPDIIVRQPTDADAAQINLIYNSYITDSHVSFDTDPWTAEQRMHWLAQRRVQGYPVLVAERGKAIVGAAWSGPWRDKSAYARSVETTVVLARDAVGAGIGMHLYAVLIDQLTWRNFHRCFAVVALPNDASIALHHKLGFTDVGVLDEAGFKDGVFVSTLLLQRKL